MDVPQTKKCPAKEMIPFNFEKQQQRLASEICAYGNGNENATKQWVNEQNNPFARALYVLVIFLPSAKQQREKLEMIKFNVFLT